jgi:hypothetical protein
VRCTTPAMDFRPILALVPTVGESRAWAFADQALRCCAVPAKDGGKALELPSGSPAATRRQLACGLHHLVSHTRTGQDRTGHGRVIPNRRTESGGVAKINRAPESLSAPVLPELAVAFRDIWIKSSRYLTPPTVPPRAVGTLQILCTATSRRRSSAFLQRKMAG